MATACPCMEVTQVIDPISTIHVLSIEDDSDRLVRTWLRQAESRKFQVTPAERLPDVARHFELSGYDCMLLDLGLPDSLGIETLVSARAIASELPIVVLTGVDECDVAEQSMRAGADHFLVKGNFGPDVLIETIVSAVDARRSRSVSFGQPVRCGAGALVSALPMSPMSAQIAGDMSDQLAYCGSWNRYRRASGMQF